MATLFKRTRNKCICNQHLDFELICCKQLKEMLNDCGVGIIYDKITRVFAIRRPTGYGSHIIDYCPWCGKQFPKNLINEYYEILANEYGINDPDNKNQQKKMPPEFKTDEWWKKRGL